VIVTRAPLRLPLGGGGTDIDSFWKIEDGSWISVTIDKYIYVIVKSRFEKSLRVAYSALEYVDSSSQLEHPIIRTVLENLDIKDHIEIASFSDLPSRTGLGSSGAFTVALSKALKRYKREPESAFPKRKLAEYAYHIEHDLLSRPVGKQDHYSAVFNGLRSFHINKKGFVRLSTLIPSGALCDWLLLFYLGSRQQPTEVALTQPTHEGLQQIKKIGQTSLECIEKGDYNTLGKFFDQHWEIKKHFSSLNKQYDKYVQQAKEFGVSGGKLIGAGAGGCLLFVCEPSKQKNVIKGLSELGLQHISFKFCRQGNVVKEL